MRSRIDARGLEVVAIGEHLPGAPERATIARLDHQVRVIVEDRVVHVPEVLPCVRGAEALSIARTTSAFRSEGICSCQV